jgi:hypothetical protein
MSYRVTVPLVLARDKEGKVHERYQDAVIDWLDDDQKRHFLESSLVEKVSGTPVADVEGDADEEAAVPDTSWTRAEIDTWAEENGLDTTGAANKGDALALIDEHLAA